MYDLELQEIISSATSAERHSHRHPSSGGEDHKKVEVVADDQTEAVAGIAHEAFEQYDPAIPVDDVVAVQTVGENHPVIHGVDVK